MKVSSGFKKDWNFFPLFCVSVVSLIGFQTYGKSSESSYLSYKQELGQLVRNLGRTTRKECPDESQASVNANNIEASFARARNRKGCESVRYYIGIIENSGGSVKQEAQYEIIQAYAKARDSYGAINAANYYLGKYGQNENVRFQLLSILRDHFSTHPGRDPFWEKMILGIHGKQQQGNPLFQNFIVRKFIEDYPRSQSIQKAEDIYELAIRNVDKHFMDVNNYLYKRKEYKAIIIRMQPIWAIGPQSDVFPESLYVSIDSFIKLAQQVDSVGKGKVLRSIGLRRIDEKRVRNLLELEVTEPIEFAKQVQFLLEQASLLMEIMEANTDANNPWVKKARKLFN